MNHSCRLFRRTLFLTLAFSTSACNDQVTGPPAYGAEYSLDISPADATLSPGDELQLSVEVTDASGTHVDGAVVELTSSDERIATVDASGRVVGLAVGTVLITAAVVGSNASDTAEVAVRDVGAFAPAPADAAAFILGPQVPIGAHPWPWFDDMQVAGAYKWYDAYMEDGSGASDYYDLALALYQLHARSGDPEHLRMARDVALKTWMSMPVHSAWPESPSAFAISPRMAPIGGLLMLALEGGADVPTLEFYNKSVASFSETYTLLDWITEFVRRQYPDWLGRRLENDHLWAGIRDGGMLLHSIAMVAKAHPDPAVRAEMTEMALQAARQYYARLQYDDGSWRWNPGNATDATQPFMVGLLLEGLIAVHQLTGDEAVGMAIVKGTEAVYRDMYDQNELPFGLLPGVKVRGLFYISYGDMCQPIVAPQAGCGNDFEADGGNWKAGNKVKVVRLRNSLVVHAFGYAYQISGDERFKEWGDDMFSATYGGDVGPGSDGYVGLGDSNKGKEYNQSFRSAGRYLAWRVR